MDAGVNASITTNLIVSDAAGAIPPNTKIATVASSIANPQEFILDAPITANIPGETILTFTQIVRPTLTGKFLASQSSWNVAKFAFNKPLQCQSLSLYFNPTTEVANGLFINDITFEYKTIHRRVL